MDAGQNCSPGAIISAYLPAAARPAGLQGTTGVSSIQEGVRLWLTQHHHPGAV